MNRKKSETRIMTKLVQVRVTPDQKLNLKARAGAFGISVGELCRQTIVGVKVNSQTDQEAIGALADARAELGRQGGMLKGWLSGAFPDAPALSDADRVSIRLLLKEIEAGQTIVIDSVKKLVTPA